MQHEDRQPDCPHTSHGLGPKLRRYRGCAWASHQSGIATSYPLDYRDRLQWESQVYRGCTFSFPYDFLRNKSFADGCLDNNETRSVRSRRTRTILASPKRAGVVRIAALRRRRQRSSRRTPNAFAPCSGATHPTLPPCPGAKPMSYKGTARNRKAAPSCPEKWVWLKLGSCPTEPG